MPRAFDTKELLLDRDPAQQIDFDARKSQFTDITLLEMVENGVRMFAGVLKDITGIDLTGLFNLINQISEAIKFDLRDIPGTIYNIVTGLPIVGNMIETVVEHLVQLFTGIFGGNDFHLIEWARSLISGLIPINRLTNIEPNLFEGIGAFPTLYSIQANPYWTWDGEVTLVPDGTGSARVEANGAIKALRSIAVTVSPETKVNTQVMVKWQNLLYTGTRPLRMQIIPLARTGYSHTTGVQYEERAPVTIAELVSPPISQGAPSTLAGTYTVPADVDAVRMRLLVDASCQQGTIWWDHAEMRRVTQFQMSWVAGLSESISDFRQWIAEIRDVYQALLDTLWQVFTGFLPDGIAKTLNDVRGAIQGALGSIRDFVQSVIDTLVNAFLNTADRVNQTISDLISAAGSVLGFGPGGLFQTVNNVIGRVFGYGVRDTTHEDAAYAIQALAEGMLANAEEIAKMQTTTTPGGMVLVDEFDRFQPGINGTTNDLGSDWELPHLYSPSGSGNMGTRSNNGQSMTRWVSGSGFREGTYIRVARSLTDYQEVSQLFAGGAQIGGLFGGHRGSNRLIAR